jgi:hypothetical protein
MGDCVIRYFRFAAGSSASYDAMRAAGDATLGIVTCIEPAATAPVDTKGRILLAVRTDSIVYPAILPSLNELLASGVAEEITEADYWASFEQVIATGGGGVSSFTDLTDKPTTRAGYGITDAQKTITSGSAAPTGGSSGDYYIQTAAAGQVTPATLSASANDYAPGNGDIYRLSASAAVNLTGWTAWTDGTLKMLVNVGSFNITLKHQSTSSSASNRFITPTAGDYVLSSGSSMVAYWDATDSRVRVF